MQPATKKLIAISGAAQASLSPASAVLTGAGQLGREVLDLLAAKNGFFAFEGALHVFPAGGGRIRDIDAWNEGGCWKNQYPESLSDIVFFAEDIFGGQFCIIEAEICTFDPETGETERIAWSVEEWAALLLRDYRTLTGWPLAHEWQERNGMLEQGCRLVPKVPFVLGGEYEVANLFSLDSVKAMRTYANLARQIRELPEGAEVAFRIVD